ncbi:HAMP domain-containing protein [Rugosimonospora africana]|uniref:histidine kinase n=1 Tax=Rugosimonospora africana TaxID=556532 RepID=A0A8J3QN32_9ACTN|nr:HAMP domain-containing protein [Rugosimonospora africana]GIH13007.1 two-component sensor histidine kinase [Rugosimonospora africana]
MKNLRLTAQTRLAVIHAGLFLAAGVALAVVIITFTFWPDTATHPPTVLIDKISGRVRLSGNFQSVLAVKQQARHELEIRLITVSVIGIVVMTAVAGFMGWVMAGRTLRPVHAVSGAARRLSQTNLHERIPVAGRDDEMRELAETFNQMLARLEKSFEAQRAFVANASHELRGPMTTQRALTEVAAADSPDNAELRDLAEAMLRQLDRQDRLVNGLLALATSDGGVTETAPVRLDRMATECLDGLAGEIDQRRLTVRLALEPSTVDGDRALIELLLSNLIRNAVLHNVPGGELRVKTRGGHVVIDNTGALVDAHRLAELAEPFRRGQRDRTSQTAGSGLGLAIARAAAHAHAAPLRLAPRPRGGIIAEVDFPQRKPLADSRGTAGATRERWRTRG